MATGIVVPLELAAVLCAGFAAAWVWLGQNHARRRPVPGDVAIRGAPSNSSFGPLRDLMHPSRLGKAVDLAVRRDTLRTGSNAVLHGQIDQIAAMTPGISSELDEQMLAHVAAVMRAGLRRGDRITMARSERDRGGFIISIVDADERAAFHIASRLRSRLGQLQLPQLSSDAQLTASFGVAAERFGDYVDRIDDRARRALDAAMRQGADCVVSASEIDDIVSLPALPKPANAPPAASAA